MTPDGIEKMKFSLFISKLVYHQTLRTLARTADEVSKKAWFLSVKTQHSRHMRTEDCQVDVETALLSTKLRTSIIFPDFLQ
jgi:hypothetical protein